MSDKADKPGGPAAPDSPKKPARPGRPRKSTRAAKPEAVAESRADAGPEVKPEPVSKEAPAQAAPKEGGRKPGTPGALKKTSRRPKRPAKGPASSEISMADASVAETSVADASVAEPKAQTRREHKPGPTAAPVEAPIQPIAPVEGAKTATSPGALKKTSRRPRRPGKEQPPQQVAAAPVEDTQAEVPSPEPSPEPSTERPAHRDRPNRHRDARREARAVANKAEPSSSVPQGPTPGDSQEAAPQAVPQEDGATTPQSDAPRKSKRRRSRRRRKKDGSSQPQGQGQGQSQAQGAPQQQARQSEPRAAIEEEEGDYEGFGFPDEPDEAEDSERGEASAATAPRPQRPAQKPGHKSVKRILINGRHEEERRVAIVEDDLLVDFYVESSRRESLKGNIYKGVVSRIEQGLHAMFVEFGRDKKGFLQLKDVMPAHYAKQPPKGAGRPKVQDVMQKGQEIIVQVEREARDTKGAGLTSYVSIPGRFMVMIPGESTVGVSRKIDDRGERSRMKEMLAELKPPKDLGFILRTAGSEMTRDDYKGDLNYLTKLWAKIQRDAKGAKAPALIYEEHDIAVRTVRDYLTSDVSEVIIDDTESVKAVKGFLRLTGQHKGLKITHYKGDAPLFDQHNLESQIAKLNERHVHLPSRGYLVIDKTEALTAIDVNSGRSKRDGNMEAMALNTNLEAVDEIARQLRLRDIGGLIVLDLIDMMQGRHRREVEQRLKAALASDKAHWDIERISKFGMIEMTRERLRTAYLDASSEVCSHCGGMGLVKNVEMAAVSALRLMHTRAARGECARMLCELPVESANYMMNVKRQEILAIEKAFKVSIEVRANADMPQGHFNVTCEKPPKPQESRK